MDAQRRVEKQEVALSWMSADQIHHVFNQLPSPTSPTPEPRLEPSARIRSASFSGLITPVTPQSYSSFEAQNPWVASLSTLAPVPRPVSTGIPEIRISTHPAFTGWPEFGEDDSPVQQFPFLQQVNDFDHALERAGEANGPNPGALEALGSPLESNSVPTDFQYMGGRFDPSITVAEETSFLDHLGGTPRITAPSPRGFVPPQRLCISEGSSSQPRPSRLPGFDNHGNAPHASLVDTQLGEETLSIAESTFAASRINSNDSPARTSPATTPSNGTSLDGTTWGQPLYGSSTTSRHRAPDSQSIEMFPDFVFDNTSANASPFDKQPLLSHQYRETYLMLPNQVARRRSRSGPGSSGPLCDTVSTRSISPKTRTRGQRERRSSSHGSSPARGKRSGPLSEESRIDANLKRFWRDRCMHCVFSKVGCKESSEAMMCERCRGKVSRHKTPMICASWSFKHKVQEGPLDMTSSQYINHYRLDNTTRQHIVIPQSLDYTSYVLNELTSHDRRIQVSRLGETLFELDLLGCRDYIASLTFPQCHTLISCIDGATADQDWRVCLAPEYQSIEAWMVLPTWTIAQRSFTYSVIGDGYRAKQLDPMHETHYRLIVVAAQLSNIVCRQMEKAGYDQLQNMVTSEKDWKFMTHEPDEHLLSTIGELILGLRYQWAIGQDERLQTFEEQQAQADAAARSKWVMKSLYAQYCWMKRIILDRGGDLPDRRSKRYPGMVHPITDTLPQTESAEGFMQWLQDGRREVMSSQQEEVKFGTDP